MFPAESRYAQQELRTYEGPDGRSVVYVLPRLSPQPDSMTTAERLSVTDSDRLDGLAWPRFGDASAWWLIADGNAAMHPAELVSRPGRTLVIPAPETGLPK